VYAGSVNRDELDWDDLRYLLAAVRAGTLAGASRALGVEHTTIGRRLSSLERALGTPLLRRGPEGLTPTPLGEALVPLVEKVEQAVAGVRDLVAVHRARVRLAMPSGFASLFAPHVASLQHEHPGLALELVSSARLVDLKKGEADLAIRIGPIADKDLVVRKLGETGWALYASHDYLARREAPRNPDDLGGHDLIGFDPSLAGVPAAKWLDARGRGATVVVRSREASDMLAAAISGVGLAVLPCMLGDAEPRLERLTVDVVATRPISLVYRREAKLSPQVRTVIRMVADVMRGHARGIAGGRPPIS
jgi:DNA-binding transcriptional LysR family regulator